MDAENKGRSFGVGGYRGRIIFLGDGTEVLTDSDDTEMFDNADEDKDLESQVSKTTTTPAAIDTAAKASTGAPTPAAPVESKPEPAKETKSEEKPKEEAEKKAPVTQEVKKD
jgi:protein phosphatase 2C family protein 2/3